MSDIRSKAAFARGLLEDARFEAVLHGIEEDARRAFLASGGDPALLTAAFQKAQVVPTLRAALQSLIDAQTVADKREQSPRGTR